MTSYIEASDLPQSVAIDPRESRKVFWAATVGTLIEYYDFVLFSLCAVFIFGPQFFPSGDPAASQLGAFAAFAVGFLVRPIGGIIAGHFGDRYGRKTVLVVSFMVMGVATALIAVLPSYAVIGIAAPIILVLLRLVQGLSAGAEWTGALVMAVENSSSKKRGISGAAPILGTVGGGALAVLVLLIATLISQEAFVAWMWRVAFALSLVLVVVGMIVRRRLHESPIFEKALENEPPRVPLVTVFKRHKVALVLGIMLVLAPAMSSYIGGAGTYWLSYSATVLKFPFSTILLATLVGAVMGLPMILLFGKLGDRFGRRRVALIALPAFILGSLAVFPVLDIGTVPALYASMMITWVVFPAVFPLVSTQLAGLFPTAVRSTGAALGYNLAYAIGGCGPLLAAAVYAATRNSFWVGALISAGGVLALIAFLIAPKDYLAGTTEGSGKGADK